MIFKPAHSAQQSPFKVLMLILARAAPPLNSSAARQASDPIRSTLLILYTWWSTVEQKLIYHSTQNRSLTILLQMLHRRQPKLGSNSIRSVLLPLLQFNFHPTFCSLCMVIFHCYTVLLTQLLLWTTQWYTVLHNFLNSCCSTAQYVGPSIVGLTSGLHWPSPPSLPGRDPLFC